jgi:protein-S-isoprenylcysteine O-methyltransferase Ste14
MTTDVGWLALTYGGMLVAAGTACLGPFSSRDGQQAGRAAWCAAWLAATIWYLPRLGVIPAFRPLTVFLALPALPHQAAASPPSALLAAAFAPAAWTVAAGLLARLARRPAAAAVIWLATIAGAGMVAWGIRGSFVGGSVASAVALGGLVDRAIARRCWLASRLVAYWASFVGTFAVLIPVAVSARDGAPRAVPLAIGAPLAGLLVLIAAPLALAATRAFVRAGGTPEPLDPPARLCRTGVYARLRHPLQLAEIFFVGSGSLLVGTRSALLFLALFAAALVGPLRIFEERRLASRFGARFEEYRRWCPAFVPRRRAAQPRRAWRSRPRPPEPVAG